MNAVEEYYHNLSEHYRATYLYIRELIKKCIPEFEEAKKYGVPFFCLNGKNVIYLYKNEKKKAFYLGFMQGENYNHPSLVFEGRKWVKVFHFDPKGDFPEEEFLEILETVKKYHQL